MKTADEERALWTEGERAAFPALTSVWIVPSPDYYRGGVSWSLAALNGRGMFSYLQETHDSVEEARRRAAFLELVVIESRRDYEGR